MTITRLPAAEAHLLVPLLRQVHDLHSARQPLRYAPTPDAGVLAEWLHDWLLHAHVVALVARQGPEVQGYAAVEIESRPASLFHPGESRGVLHHISIDAAHRRQGIGTALVQAVQAHLLQRDIPTLVTSYASFNTASARLMARCGLHPVTIRAEWRAPRDQPQPSTSVNPCGRFGAGP